MRTADWSASRGELRMATAGSANLLLHSDRPALFFDIIRARFPQLAISHCSTYEGIATALHSVQPDIVLSHKFEHRPYPGRALVDAPSVRWIHVGGTGVDHFRPWPRDRLTITNSAGAPRAAMAEYVLGAIYALNLGLPDRFRAQLRREWIPGSIRVTAGGTIVVIGLGRIGRSICAIAKAAGLRVLGVRTRAEPVPEVDEVFTTDRMNDALTQADYVVVVVPLTDRTTALIDERAITAIRPGALLVNVSRGGVVDETSLLSALRSGHLRGAVIDVFEIEPLPSESPFWQLDNVLVTPHVAGFFDGWEQATAEIFCENLARWLAGQRPLLNEVDADIGY
jgi:phosphoglycerate dehydrogenase-like enzyme